MSARQGLTHSVEWQFGSNAPINYLVSAKRVDMDIVKRRLKQQSRGVFVETKEVRRELILAYDLLTRKIKASKIGDLFAPLSSLYIISEVNRLGISSDEINETLSGEKGNVVDYNSDLVPIVSYSANGNRDDDDDYIRSKFEALFITYAAREITEADISNRFIRSYKLIFDAAPKVAPKKDLK